MSRQSIAALALLVPDYDDGIAFFVGRFGFELVEDAALSPTKRWVRVRLPGATETSLLLARAASPARAPKRQRFSRSRAAPRSS